jgi:hypothetical protein
MSDKSKMSIDSKVEEPEIQHKPWGELQQYLGFVRVTSNNREYVEAMVKNRFMEIRIGAGSWDDEIKEYAILTKAGIEDFKVRNIQNSSLKGLYSKLNNALPGRFYGNRLFVNAFVEENYKVVKKSKENEIINVE